jgi:transcriptional regulator with XRE-family HTH domain
MPRRFSGTKLRSARKASGIRLERLALDIGRSAAQIAAIECGRKRPSIGTAVALADRLGVRLDDFLDDEAPDAA